MNCSPNIITANFSGGRHKAKTAWRHQWDHGQVLCVTGIDDLPLTFTAHFSVHKEYGAAQAVEGIDGQVEIPDIWLTFGKTVYCWIYITDGESGETVYTITIPVIPRPMPEYYEMEDTGVFDGVVAEVSGYAESADDAATRAAASATAAAQSASAAAASEESTSEGADRAEYAMQQAVSAQNEATTQATIATEKASQASGYATAAGQSATSAEQSKTSAANAATAAGQAASAAGNSATTASTKAGEADQSATDAAESATAAAGSATAASGSAATAAARAAEAANSAGQAATARDAATTAQGAAETAASGASQSATAAAGSATAAAGSATAAAGSETTASTKADEAAASAAAAAASAASLTVDNALSDSSTNPVQNKVITAELTDVKSAIDVLTEVTAVENNVELERTTKGYWTVSDGIASLYEQSTGSYFAFPAIAVVPGTRYTITMRANNGHGASIILAYYANDAYTVVDSITVTGDVRGTYTIDVPTSGATHLLVTKYSIEAATVTYLAPKTDKTLSIEDVAAEAKATGDRFTLVEQDVAYVSDEVHDELFELKTKAGGYLVSGIIGTDGACVNNTNYALYRIDVESLVGIKITAYSDKNVTNTLTMVFFAFYDIPYADITRSGATAEHCTGIGATYPPGAAMAITERLIVPQGTKTMLICIVKNSEITPRITYYESLDLKDKIANPKLPYQAGNIFFTVDCPRPIPFGDDTYTTLTDETVQCVLRLPVSYQQIGTPTRLVLACHGSSGYIDAGTDTWYNSNWNGLMNYLVNAGYAVFDANIFGGSDTNVMGFALGSPLYAQVLKRAYDYIQDNYNVYPQIFAHGTSMGGVGIKTFTHFYPELVLAQSSFAGRDICKYLHLMNVSAQTLPYSGRTSVAYGYADDAALYADHFSHCVGMSDSLGILKIQNGAIVMPPNRETAFSDWVDYYAELNKQTQNSDLTGWIGSSAVPYKAWNAWNDEEESAAQEILMQKAYEKTNSAPYYAITYTLTDEEVAGSTAHTKMSYGQVRDMRSQLIAWYKRWE